MANICSEEKVFCQFPSNLRVLAIDNDSTVLEFIKKTCNEYCYQVITCTESLRATNIFQDRKVSINLVIMELHMPKMDGYEFLLVNQEMGVPVIMMSLDDDKKSVMKAIKLGACDYWIKPLHEDRLKNMWTHIVKKSMSENKRQKDISSLEDDNNLKRMVSDNYKFVFSSTVEVSREVDNVGESEKCGPPSTKKSRIVWTSELHGRFVKAVNQIGLANAVPNKILELMNTPGLTRNNVASHLQKYRNVLKIKSDGEKLRKQQLQSMGTLDDASRHGVWSPYDAVLAENQAMLQNNVSVDKLQQQQHQEQMQQSLMRNQLPPINFQSSPMIISENPYFVTGQLWQKY